MKLHSLSPVVSKSSKRIGRGIGSGRGKTSGRGTKGLKARGKVRLGFIGGSLPLYRKLPLRRGQGNSAVSISPVIVKLNQLNVLKAGSVVDVESLVKSGIITEGDAKKGVKLLATGELTNNLVIRIPVSESAKQKIEEQGGKVEYV